MPSCQWHERSLREDPHSELATPTRVAQDFEVQRGPHLGVVRKALGRGHTHKRRINVSEGLAPVQVDTQSERVDTDHHASHASALVESRPCLGRVRVEAPHLVCHRARIRVDALSSALCTGSGRWLMMLRLP